MDIHQGKTKPATNPPKVALFLVLAYTGSRAECRGILDYAGENGPWQVLLQEGRLGEQLLDLRKLGVSGVIAECPTPAEASDIASLGVPVVLLEDPAPGGALPAGHPLAGAPCVRMDSRAVGRMAAEYYLERGYTNFAYVDETLGLYWGAERRDGFLETVRAAGCECAIYGGRFTVRERARWSAERPRMIRFLESLPRPTAVLAAMDGRARLVIEACSAAGLRVPEEIAVLGVDDDPLLCEATMPTLSSVRTDRYRHGREAAVRLDALMRGCNPEPRDIAVPPIGVRTRDSTGYDAMRDPFMARAIAYIRNRSDTKIDVADVVAAAGCSRRYLETRFRARLGTTILGMAQRERIGRVKELLESTALPIGEIAERCGFPGNSDLSILFRRIAGTSMREWRLRHHSAEAE